MQMPQKVVIASQHYPPDQSTTAAIMCAIASRLALDVPVLVLSGTSGSASAVPTGASQPAVAEIKNWMPSKGALIKRAIAEILVVVRIFFKLLKQFRPRAVVVTGTAAF